MVFEGFFEEQLANVNSTVRRADFVYTEIKTKKC